MLAFVMSNLYVYGTTSCPFVRFLFDPPYLGRLLEGVPDLIVLAEPDLLLLLGDDVLDPHLLGVRAHELADEARVPELRGDAQVLAAAHQGVGLAALGRGRDAVLVEVLLFATGLADESVWRVLVHCIARVKGRKREEEEITYRPWTIKA